MHPVLVVARREFVQRVFRWHFLLLTFGLPLLWVTMFGLALVVEQTSAPEALDVVVVDRTGLLHDQVVTQLQDRPQPGYRVVDAPDGDTSEAALDAAVLDGRIGGWVVLDGDTLARGDVGLRALAFPGLDRESELRKSVFWAAVRQRLGGGDDPGVDALLEGGSVAFVDLDQPDLGQTASAVETGRKAVAFIGAMMLYMTVLLYPVQLLMSVVEEKLNGLVELLLCSIRPWQLLLGKVLGVGSAGLLQLAVWLTPELGLTWMLRGRMEGLPAADREALASLMQAAPGPMTLLVLAVCFVLGFFFYASVYAAVGALCASEKDAELAQTGLGLSTSLMALPLVAVFRDANSTVATVLSFVPPFTPFMMFPRYVLGAPLWQLFAAWVLLAVSIVGLAFVAGRIYRVGMLAQGNRPGPAELWRWIVQSS